MQLGFILGTFGSALANLPDVLPPRYLMIGGALGGAAANAARGVHAMGRLRALPEARRLAHGRR